MQSLAVMDVFVRSLSSSRPPCVLGTTIAGSGVLVLDLCPRGLKRAGSWM